MDAPVPYILGVPTPYLELVSPETLQRLVVVDIDNNAIRVPEKLYLPRALAKQLKHTIKMTMAKKSITDYACLKVS